MIKAYPFFLHCHSLLLMQLAKKRGCASLISFLCHVANQMKYQLADNTKVAKEDLERMMLTHMGI